MTSDYLEAPVAIDPDKPLRASADAMRAFTKATGSTLTDVLQGEDDADRFQALAFFELHVRAAKAGHLPDAGELYELAGRVTIVFEAPANVVADPLDAGSSRTSPRSAATGG
jgi:nucleoid DNA-binding protein